MGTSMSHSEVDAPASKDQVSQGMLEVGIQAEGIYEGGQDNFTSGRPFKFEAKKGSEQQQLQEREISGSLGFRSSLDKGIKMTKLAVDSQYEGTRGQLQPVQRYLEGNHQQMTYKVVTHSPLRLQNSQSDLQNLPDRSKQIHDFNDLTMSFGKAPGRRTSQRLHDPSNTDISSSKIFKEYEQNSIEDSAYVSSSRIGKSSIMEPENDAFQGFICLNSSVVHEQTPVNEQASVNRNNFLRVSSVGEENKEKISDNNLGHMPIAFELNKESIKITESRVNSCGGKMARLQPSKRLIFDGDDTYIFISSPPTGSSSSQTIGKLGPVYYGENKQCYDMVSTTKQTVQFDEHCLMSFKQAISQSSMQHSLPAIGVGSECKDGVRNKMVSSADANYAASLIPITQVYYATHIIRNEESEKAKSNGMLNSSCCKISPAHLEMNLMKQKEGIMMDEKQKKGKIQRQRRQTGRKHSLKAPMKRSSRSKSRRREKNGDVYI